MSYNTLIAYVYFGCTSVLLLTVMALFVQRLSSSRTAILFSRFVWALTAWAAADVLEFVGPSEMWSEFWYGTFRSTAICSAAVAWVWFCVEYARYAESFWALITKRAVLLVGSLFALVSWTPLRSLLYSDLSFEQQQSLWSPISREVGPWFGAYFAFGVSCSLIGLVVLAIYIFRTGPLSRWQILAVAAAGALNSLIAICSGCGLLGMPMLDKTVFTLPISVLLFATSLQRLGFLQASPVLLNTLVNNIPVGVWAIDPDGYLVDANSEGIELLTTEQETRRHRTPLFKRVSDVMPAKSPLREIDFGKETNRQELVLSSQAGEQIYCVDTIPLRDSHRGHQGHLVVFRNETVLRKYMSDLDAYAQRAAHDLKGPLAAILNMAELIQLEPEAKETKQLGSQIANIVFSMDHIITEMLLVASIQDGDVSHLVPLDVAERAKAVIQKLQLRESKIRIQDPSNWASALGREVWVEEILANLILNSLEHADQPELCITLTSKNLGEFIEYSVADNGRGIDQETASRLFASNQPSPNEDGQPRGLGLSIVRRLVEKQGGSMGYRRTGETGGAFWFQLKSCPRTLQQTT